MLKQINELRKKRAKLVADARAILDSAGDQALSEERSAQYDAILSEVQKFAGQIERLERQMEIEASLAEQRAESDDQIEHRARTGNETAADRAMREFRNYLQTGAAPSVDSGLEVERRDLAAGSNTQGGYIVAPEIFVNQLIKAVDDVLFIRTRATIYQGHKIGAPSLDADPDDFDWVGELSTGTADTAMAVGKRVMEAHPLRKQIKISNDLINSSAMNVEQLVQGRMAYKLANTQEKSYLAGSGALQPLGLFTASEKGLPVSRDVSDGNTTTAITADGLINAKYALKSQYQSRAEWIFHRDAVKQIAKLKDGDGQYLWRPSIEVNRPDMLLGSPINQSEYAPNTFTTGSYIGIYGDISHYWILDNPRSVMIQRLNELFSRTNQTGYIFSYAGDGAPVLAEAFARVKLA